MGFRHAHLSNKYHAKRTAIDGIRFDSMAEAEYYLHLKSLQALGRAKILEIQPKVYLTEARILYKIDFLIEEMGEKFFVDVKGMATPTFKLKAKLFEYYGEHTLRLVQKTRLGFVTTKEIKARAR